MAKAATKRRWCTAGRGRAVWLCACVVNRGCGVAFVVLHQLAYPRSAGVSGAALKVLQLVVCHCPSLTPRVAPQAVVKKELGPGDDASFADALPDEDLGGAVLVRVCNLVYAHLFVQCKQWTQQQT
jgi:hypothetical protein